MTLTTCSSPLPRAAHLDTLLQAAVAEHMVALSDDPVLLLVLAHGALDHLRTASSRGKGLLRVKQQQCRECLPPGLAPIFFGNKNSSGFVSRVALLLEG